MRKKTVLSIGLLLLVNGTSLLAQSLTPTSEISTAGSADAFKGGYTFSYATSGTPWNGALISFGGFQYNNYDCQISSDYGPNGGNHISYRTKNGDKNTWNSWNELATRGSNYFTGNQSIAGNLGIGTDNPNSKLEIIGSSQLGYEVGTLKLKSATVNQFMYFGYDDQYSAGYIQSVRPGTDQQNILIAPAGGNVGIGTKSPDARLAVNGTIHSKEVKVDLNGWSDFVFKKEYDLPTLEQVEKHINEKGHLEYIPSEEEVLKNGINLGEMNAKLLQKIEELTLYLIDQNKQLKTQNDQIQLQNKEIQLLKKVKE
ncbi:hypothetical protein [Flavobacterium sp.]|uniref:hypothetical protein n=1 Tax=Flavobacterium sp. TaxID=239 RepID=UPI003D0C93EA